jgi:RNA polymerase sigma factor (sigma-70 family)
MIEMERITTAGVPAAPPDDAAVIARSRHEPELFALLFRRHAARLYRFIARRIGPGPAEDVLSETFLAAFSQRSRYDVGFADARPWLYGIATNLVGRHRRAEVNQLRLYQRTGADVAAVAFTEQADARVAAQSARQRVAIALGKLRPVYRDALLLLAWGELTYEEAARAVGVPVGTIRSRISRARRLLREELRDLDPGTVLEDFDE